MANGKFVTMFTLVTSLVIVIFATQVCSTWSLSVQNNPVFSLYEMVNYIDAAQACQVGQETQVAYGQVNFTSNFTNATSSLTTLSTGATGSFGISSFIDVIKLVIGFVSLLLGLPLYTFLFTIGLNVHIATLLTIFLGTYQIISIMEFLGGRIF